MILFVFEGKDDKTYFESIKWLFLSKKSDTFVCTYNIRYIVTLYFSNQLSNYVETEECKVTILNELPIPSSTTLEER